MAQDEQKIEGVEVQSFQQRLDLWDLTSTGVVVCLAHLPQTKSPTPDDVRFLVFHTDVFQIALTLW
jgi:hypothetical protein